MTGVGDPAVGAWLDQQEQLVAQHVREHGVHLEYVFGDPARERPPFCYTVGLFGIGHPELLVLGLNMDNAAGVLNDLAGQVYDGRRLMHGEVVTFEEWRHRLFVEESPNPGEIVYAANIHYRRPAEHSVPVLHLTVDDRSGRFPWEDGYDIPAWRQARPGEFRA